MAANRPVNPSVQSPRCRRGRGLASTIDPFRGGKGALPGRVLRRCKERKYPSPHFHHTPHFLVKTGVSTSRRADTVPDGSSARLGSHVAGDDLATPTYVQASIRPRRRGGILGDTGFTTSLDEQFTSEPRGVWGWKLHGTQGGILGFHRKSRECMETPMVTHVTPIPVCSSSRVISS
jgi:hypothetical protein